MKQKVPIKKRIQLLALRAALVAVRLPLRAASALTWHLESLRSRLQTSVDSIRNSYE
jgi:hypothetical protein